MAKQFYRILDNLSPSEMKLINLPRKPDGLHNLSFNEYGQLIKRKGYTKYNTTLLHYSEKIRECIDIISLLLKRVFSSL